MGVSPLSEAPPAVHLTHRPILLPALGSLIGCSQCWRLLGMRQWGVITAVARQRCNLDQDLAKLVSDCRERAVECGRAAADRTAHELRTALAVRVGGRHRV